MMSYKLRKVLIYICTSEVTMCHDIHQVSVLVSVSPLWQGIVNFSPLAKAHNPMLSDRLTRIFYTYPIPSIHLSWEKFLFLMYWMIMMETTDICDQFPSAFSHNGMIYRWRLPLWSIYIFFYKDKVGYWQQRIQLHFPRYTSWKGWNKWVFIYLFILRWFFVT